MPKPWCSATLRLGGGAATALLGGCADAAPTIPLFGALFPAWLACASVGIVGAVVVRLAFIPLGLDDALPVRLPVYVAVAAIIGLLTSLVGFGR